LIVKEPNGQFRPETEWTRRALVDNEDIRAANLASYSDGSVENDLPMQQLSELFNVNHFVVSQVNPHSAILSSMAGGITATVWSNPVYNAVVGFLRFLTAQSRDWLKNVVKLFVFRSRSPTWSSRRGFTQMLTQDYEGRDVDVTINPWSQHISAFTALRSAIHNPSRNQYMGVIAAAEKATWPAIPRIRAHCLVEMTLDQCVNRLRRRITEESVAAHQALAIKLRKLGVQSGVQGGARPGRGAGKY
jgi:TAG lipase/steryl ester hydrolase/phospholipase A2/LPA acyltransferase